MMASRLLTRGAAGFRQLATRSALHHPSSHSTLARLPIQQCRSIFSRLGGDNKSVVPAISDEERALAKPINFDVASKIEGGETQIAVIDLEPGQLLRAETGSLLYMTEGVSFETSLGGGIGAGMKRMLTGENMFIADFKYEGEEGTHGTVALGTEYPSKIMRVSLANYGGALVCQKGAFLAGTHSLQIEMEYTRTFKAGFFGGEGFILQRLTGDGDAFIKAGGALIRRELREGETLKVTGGALVAFAPTVSYDVQMVKGVKNIMMGGEGLFLTTLTGPGTVYLQSMPFDRLIGAIAARVPRGGGFGMGVPIGAAGGGGGEGGEGAAEGGEGAGEGEGVGAGSTASAAGFGESTASSSSGSEPSQDDVWKEEAGEGAGGEEFEEAGQATEGVGEVLKDIWGSIWDEK